MKNQKLFYFLILTSVLVLSGCVARTYPLTRDRVDQDLASGNRGFLMGKSSSESTSPRKETRTVRVFEFEFGRTYKTDKTCAPVTTVAKETGAENVSAEPLVETETTGTVSQKYTVAKNDTLQKISQKFYGTSKNWMKIYNANTDVLKGPDKVYPGQILNIPDISKGTLPVNELKEPKENLK